MPENHARDGEARRVKAFGFLERYALLWMAMCLLGWFAAAVNLIWPFPAWARYTFASAMVFGGCAFLLALRGSRRKA